MTWAACLHRSVALLHMFCKKHEQEKIEWKDSELQSCRQRKNTGGISDGVDTADATYAKRIGKVQKASLAV